MNIDNKVHLIGNAHIDPVWLWRYPDGLAEVKATFQAALDRMEEFPGFIFTCSSAYYYKWIEENAPEIFGKIKARIKEGRWVPVGGMWVQPDCNIPSGESFIRQMLYSQRYFFEKFGLLCRTGYNVDSFGHNGMLPQLLKGGGMESYIFMRPGGHEKPGLDNLFIWESPDGSRVLAYKIPFSYGEWLDSIKESSEAKEYSRNRKKITDVMNLGERQSIPMMSFYGVGNHGGGATVKGLKEIEQILEEHKGKVLYSSPDKYFRDVDSIRKNLPVLREDLQHHASGCYSAHSLLKLLNCRAENRLISAEKIMTIATSLLHSDYDFNLLKRAWEQVMFNQFHDILAGTSIREACDDAVESFQEALSIASRLRNAAFQKISWAVDTVGKDNIVLSKETDWMIWESDCRGTPVVVFNPLSFPVRTGVKINKEIKGVTNWAGQPVRIQRIRGSYIDRQNKYNTFFLGEIPAFGYAIFWLFRVNSFDLPSFSSLSVSKTHMENNYLRFEFDSNTGWIRNIVLKELNMQILKGPACVPLIVDEMESDTWAHGIYEFRKVIGRFSDAKISVMEQGPLRVVVKVISRYKDSILEQSFTLYEESRDLEVSVKLDLRMKHKIIKLSFPLDLDKTRAVYEIPYGHIIKETNGQEEPGHRWVALQGKNRQGEDYGFALINCGKYSFDMKENDLRMTIARTTIYANHFGKQDKFCEYMDQGEQEFDFVISPLNGLDYAALSRRALELNQKSIHIVETYHKGPLPLIFSGIEISHDNIICSVYKRCEDNNGTILRCYEAGGFPVSNVHIVLPGVNRRTITADFKQQQIKTFFIPDDLSKDIKETNFLEFINDHSCPN